MRLKKIHQYAFLWLQKIVAQDFTVIVQTNNPYNFNFGKCNPIYSQYHSPRTV